MDTHTTQKEHTTTDDNRRSSPALEVAAAVAAGLGKPTSLPLRPKDEALLEGLETFRFGPDNTRKGWTVGDGPLVVLVHGYTGRGVQMATLAHGLAANGYRCVFFDAGGHGESASEKVGFFTFINDTRDLVRHLNEPLHAMIGHSAGGLAMMRARALHGVHAGKYAVIAAPFFPYVPLDNMRKRGAPEQAFDHVKAILADQFQTAWSKLAAGEAYMPEEGAELLAVYDTEDEMVRHTDADALGQVWPGTRIAKTQGLGHNRILQAEETLKAVRAFVDG